MAYSYDVLREYATVCIHTYVEFKATLSFHLNESHTKYHCKPSLTSLLPHGLFETVLIDLRQVDWNQSLDKMFQHLNAPGFIPLRDFCPWIFPARRREISVRVFFWPVDGTFQAYQNITQVL